MPAQGPVAVAELIESLLVPLAGRNLFEISFRLLNHSGMITIEGSPSSGFCQAAKVSGVMQTVAASEAYKKSEENLLRKKRQKGQLHCNVHIFF